MAVNLTFLNKDLKPARGLLKRWINEVVKAEGSTLGEINIIFASDEYLLALNRDYLNHNYFTDVITFDYCQEKVISGDIFISIDRVKENGKVYGQGERMELLRVIIHGVLHLLGYKDKSKKQKDLIRAREDLYLFFANSKFDFLGNGFK